ncbi:D-3-phosphoglycerate dehydrogenase [Methanocaldococcus infernus ME]|uniref:D-3-phosphoglycerate dehydrogenase n=1 Tax=Methanocaldococcus infernus (strain DSM 11812 / JCM 15783 / ME) TaxID=573063 RepID=D5VRI4_METIM|nr:phosphoglycerate dehydrogenase [Methanocaldococcus infernus]ADG13187.1 D-3-phosphoglycerate dehydrogenase [Methanocaldococcus infernus ME]
MKILITDPIHEEAIKILKELGDVVVATDLSREELLKEIEDTDILVVRSGTKVDRELIERGKRLKIIGRAGVGVDNIDVEAATERGIIVVNAPDASSISVAELTIGLMLAAARNIVQANNSVKRGEWNRKKFKGIELYGKTLGVVGLGRIGQQVVKRAKAFGMNIIAYDPYVSKEFAESLGVKLVDDLNKLCELSDVITLHVPLTPKTKNMIGEEQIKRMKEGAIIVNCARGGLIDEKALYEALKNKKIRAAALDVFEEEPPKNNPLLELENLICTPHLGASTEEAQRAAGTIVAEQIKKIVNGELAENIVNMPNLPAEVLGKIKPYMVLAELLGNIVMQVLDGSVKRVEVIYYGNLSKENTDLINRALLKGLLSPILLAGVNLVNAPILAKNRGIEFIESKSNDTRYGNAIKVVAEANGKSFSLVGSISNNKPIILEIEGYEVNFIPESVVLIIRHIDKPGMIGKVGTILGEYGINIAEMQVGRKEPGGDSVMLIKLDHNVPEEVLKKIKEIENIKDAVVVKL